MPKPSDAQSGGASKPSGGSSGGSSSGGGYRPGGSSGGSTPSKGTKSKGGGSKGSTGRPSGGKGGSAGPTRSPATQKFLLGQARLQFPFDISRYVEETIRLGEGSEYLYARILASPEFNSRFIGIKRKDGSLRMSPSEYIDREEKYTSAAARYGFNLTKYNVGGLMMNDVDPEEFEIRAKGIQLAKTNPGLVKKLNEQIRDRNAELIRQGRPPLKSINNLNDAVSFFVNRADAEVYDLYESAQFAENAEAAGIKMSNKRARELAAGTAGVMDYEEVQKGFANIASQLREAGADLVSFGLTDDDVTTIEFGGKGRATLALKAAQALKQARGAREAEGATEFVDYQSGTYKTRERREQGL